MTQNDSNNSPAPLPAGWTAIAERPRSLRGASLLTWSPLPGAPVDIGTAHSMETAGRIVMANRHTRDRVELVVRPVLAPIAEAA